MTILETSNRFSTLEFNDETNADGPVFTTRIKEAHDRPDLGLHTKEIVFIEYNRFRQRIREHTRFIKVTTPQP